MEELADAITAALLHELPDDPPLALFGHSMGSAVAYEVAGAGAPPGAGRQRDPGSHPQAGSRSAAAYDHPELRLLGLRVRELLSQPAERGVGRVRRLAAVVRGRPPSFCMCTPCRSWACSSFNDQKRSEGTQR
ncbi:thioesterase domain-containing protein [Streptomyces sp. AC550_RSS872]|uniref:thioesterase domain-containing protein n=1 Tax=Streptomyces sp. AC550_RSS872 TaxID=2823689 RepID=UPI0027E46FFE|nr:thioesterase domain-containing protein [Streptomyces sp. AC550_RSS872]